MSSTVAPRRLVAVVTMTAVLAGCGGGGGSSGGSAASSPPSAAASSPAPARHYAEATDPCAKLDLEPLAGMLGAPSGTPSSDSDSCKQEFNTLASAALGDFYGKVTVTQNVSTDEVQAARLFDLVRKGRSDASLEKAVDVTGVGEEAYRTQFKTNGPRDGIRAVILNARDANIELRVTVIAGHKKFDGVPWTDEDVDRLYEAMDKSVNRTLLALAGP